MLKPFDVAPVRFATAEGMDASAGAHKAQGKASFPPYKE
jgi:hypothetical protein